MPQVYMDLANEIVVRVLTRVKARGAAVYHCLADPVRRQAGDARPDGSFETIVGGWVGDDLERPAEGALEKRGTAGT